MPAHRALPATQVYRVYIKAPPQAIWDAITRPEWTAFYGYTGVVDYDLRPGGSYRIYATEAFKAASAARGVPAPDVVVEGEVLDVDPPRRIITTYRMLVDPDMAAEPATRVTHEIKEASGGTCLLTVTHELAGAPRLAAFLGGELEDQGAGGGYAWHLSDLKTLLETGRPFAG